jgi:hypothetical protein
VLPSSLSTEAAADSRVWGRRQGCTRHTWPECVGICTIDPQATGFFVIWQSDSTRPVDAMEPECAGIYLVTARHVAHPLGSHFVIRFNKKHGGSAVEPIQGARWFCHPDRTVDVAILHCGYPDWADCVPIPGRCRV